MEEWLKLLVYVALWCRLSTLGHAGFAHFEGRQVHPMGLTPDGSRLLVLNTPDSRLSVFDLRSGASVEPLLVAEIPVGLEPVSLRAFTDDEVWVVNELSDSLSIVSLRRGIVVETIPCGDEPADIVFARGKAFVSCARNGVVRVFDVLTRAEVGQIRLKGVSPRALAVDTTGLKVFVAFQFSGNRTTVLPVALAPSPPSPLNTNLPAAPDTALIVNGDDARIRYKLLDHDVAELSTVTLEVAGYRSDLGTVLFDLVQRPGTEELWVSNTEALNRTQYEPALRGHFVDHRLTRVELGGGRGRSFDLNPGVDYARLPNPEAWERALAQPGSLIFSADGREGWVAAFGSDRVARFDPGTGEVLNRVDLRVAAVGDTVLARGFGWVRGPRGLALDDRTGRLYVLNKLSNTLTVVDARRSTVLGEVLVGSADPTPGNVREGRGFLFDARRSGNGLASCAGCHVDMDRDGLAWDLGDPNGELVTVMGANLASHDTRPRPRVMHPMKGPMVTQTLRGLGTNQLLHWRGDRGSIREFNGAFDTLLGGTKLTESNLDALEAYLLTLRHHPNPHRTLEDTLPAVYNGANPIRGRELFTTHLNHCGVCHVLPTGSDNNVDSARNFGGSQFIKTPPLQTVYQRALLDSRAGAENVSGIGLGHDGTGGNQTLPTVHFYELDQLEGADFGDVSAFLYCFETGTAPAVGFNRTVTWHNVKDPSLEATLATLERQAMSPGQNDLVACGVVGGAWGQFYFDRAVGGYRSGRAGEALRTRAQLLALIGDGDALSFLGVLPSDGVRLGTDRNQDGVGDGDEVTPRLSVDALGGSLRLTWETASLGWLLEQTPRVDGPWRPVPAPRLGLRGSLLVDSHAGEERALYFRLRRTWW